ncbi:DUF3078 domain-containing protein [Pontibacter brevis]
MLVVLLTGSATVLAQTAADTTWRRTFSAGINLNQAAFSDNWKAGGISSIALNSHLDARADYSKGRVSWDNEVQLQYGLIKNNGQEMRKSIDRIYLDSKYGHKLTSDWNTFASANFLSQFAPGYNYDTDADGTDVLISNFLSPGFLTFALGAEYKPTPSFSLRMSPFAPRFTFLVDEDVAQTDRYGVPVGSKVRTEWLAAMVQANFKRDIATNLNLRLNYMGYLNYGEFTFKRVDHRLNAVLNAKVNRYINVNLTGNLIYDYDQDPGVQYSQALGLGILYTLRGFSLNR